MTTTTKLDDGNARQEAAKTPVEFSRQAERLSLQRPKHGGIGKGDEEGTVAIEARFITPHDPVIVVSDGTRLPAVPLEEAHKLNMLRDGLDGKDPLAAVADADKLHEQLQNEASTDGTLKQSMPPSSTNPLFPPLPLWGPPSLLRSIQCKVFRVTSFFLSLAFLAVIVLGALFTSIPGFLVRQFQALTRQNPDASRPFYEEEIRRQKKREDEARGWKRRTLRRGVWGDGNESTATEFPPTEGGPDPVVCDLGYYARRIGLDVEEFQVKTEDGFIIDLFHVYDPKEYASKPESERGPRGPDVFTEPKAKLPAGGKRAKFPVLLVHGLLQSAGAYCVNDDDSLAFYLCKAGFDVWLGNNRCGFSPKHETLKYGDPRMWCWNIRQMGVLDLPALTSRVLSETGFEKLGLVCHSQGTTQAFVALAKEQRPDLGEKITVFCALAPAAYAGPLIGKMYFKFMRVISPAHFRLMFGIHAFIPFMMTMHKLLHPRLYGWLGYKVFSFLFDWSDERWDRGLRDRMFQFAPVYVSSESMRWWLGRECFARHKCILSTREMVVAEDKDDEPKGVRARAKKHAGPEFDRAVEEHRRKPRGATAWYNRLAPPFALWVAGNDDLVDGRKLLRRFETGREPFVNVVHTKVIDGYEHLDVIWAMDAVEKVFEEVKEVLWKTCHAREECRIPAGCEQVGPWVPPPTPVGHDDDQEQTSSGSDE